MDILIINTNRYRQLVPVIPVNACMIAEAGHKVRVLDLMFERAPLRALKRIADIKHRALHPGEDKVINTAKTRWYFLKHKSA